jgi:hypothetical protein
VTTWDVLSAAADTVSGIACTPEYRQSTETGHAFVQLDHIDWPDRLGGIATWQIYVMLPADKTEAEKFISTITQLLYDALRPELVVRSITPQQTQFEPGGPALPTLVVQGTREWE